MISPSFTSVTASALSCISGTSSKTSVIRSVDASAIMIITNTKVTIIREPMICNAYTMILVNSPVPIVPWMIPVPPIATSRSITTYIVNCITGEFHATIFSAFVNSVYTYLEIPWNLSIL